jgi:hypothetical protein
VPFAAVLVGLAVADANEALRLTGPRAYAARYAWAVAALAVLLLVVGFAAPVVLAVVAVALLLWALRRALADR